MVYPFDVCRSFLFTPGNHPRRVEKVFEVGADAVMTRYSMGNALLLELFKLFRAQA